MADSRQWAGKQGWMYDEEERTMPDEVLGLPTIPYGNDDKSNLRLLAGMIDRGVFRDANDPGWADWLRRFVDRLAHLGSVPDEAVEALARRSMRRSGLSFDESGPSIRGPYMATARGDLEAVLSTGRRGSVAEHVHTVTLVLRVNSRTPQEAEQKVKRIFAGTDFRGLERSSAGEITDVRPGWRPGPGGEQG